MPANSIPALDLVVIGGGAMATALVHGAIAAGVLEPGRVIVADPDPDKRATFPASRASAPQALAAAPPDAAILLAIKPQSLAGLADELRAASVSLDGRLVISILAGTPVSRVTTSLTGAPRVIRAMPNTPARIRQGITALACPPRVRETDRAAAHRLFQAVGSVIEINESQMDAFTAVAGSGPAYLFYLAEAMTIAAVRLGFEPATADLIVRQTLAGSSGLLLGTPDRSAADLRAAVTSKGGTTAAATAVFDDAKVLDTIITALRAARDRGRELAMG